MAYKGTLFIISGPSGVGKTSLVKKITDTVANIVLSISYTTRPKRPKEQNGINYFFVSKEFFLTMQNNQEFLEHAEIFDHYYGTSKQFVINMLEQGKDVILEIDYQGAAQIKASFVQSTCLSIFILPPTLQSLTNRLTFRKQDEPIVIQKRLNNAKTEIAHYTKYNYLIINEDFDKTIQDLSIIIYAQRLIVTKQQDVYADLINNLLT